jgi:uncharacterized protein YkwD
MRSLFLAGLLAVLTLVTATASPAVAAAKGGPVAKIALGDKRVVRKAKKAKAGKRVKAAKTSVKRRATATPAPAPAAPAPAPAAASAAVVAPPAPAACANTEIVPDAGNLELVRAALACLHNQVRAQNGLGTLADNGALATAATGHSADMVARTYFDHTTPDGVSFSDRILAAGYAGRNGEWTVGENLAWGTGALATPAAIMQAWLNSAGHRANILKPQYRELGLGVRLGSPTGPDGVTVSAEFGARD